ncbi:MAG: hypothetical protein ACK46L_17020 [Synechococcaceae cyanobacterium]
MDIVPLLLVLLLVLLLLLVPLGVVLIAVQLSRLGSRVSQLEARLRSFEQREGPPPERSLSHGSAAAGSGAAGAGGGTAPAASRVDSLGPAQPARVGSRPAGEGPRPASPVRPELPPPIKPRVNASPPPPRRDQGRELDKRLPWRGLERQLIENWTGLIGVLVLVAGITFLVVNIALRLGPLARFLLTLAAAAALIAPSLRWGRHPRWRSLVAWLRSGGAALALFACLAGGSLPELGLRWLEDPRQALALLLLGMALNLAVAGLSRDQTVASLHVLVNLVPLLLVQQSPITLAVASLVCLAGLVLAARRPWDRHRLQVLLGYGVFQGVWLLRLGESLVSQPALRLGGLATALVVFGAGVLLLQRRSHSLPAAHLAALIAAWGGLGLALMAYPQQAASRVIGLLLAAALALLLAWLGRHGKARPLGTAQILISQGLVVAALLSLQPLLADGLLLNLVLLGESGLFLLLGLRELLASRRILQMGWGLVAVLAMAVLLQAWVLLTLPTFAPQSQGLGHVSPGPGAIPAQPFRPALLLLRAAALLVGVAWQLDRRGVALAWPPLLGLQAAALVLLGTAGLTPHWRPCWALLGMGSLLIADRRLRPPGLGMATAGAIPLAQLTSWGWLLAHRPQAAPALAQLLPLLALAIALIALASGPRRQALGLDLLGLNLGLGADLLLRPLSPLLPPLAWLLLSLPALLVADRLRQPLSSHGLALGLVALAAYALGFVIEIAFTATAVDVLGFSLHARHLIELLAVLVLAVWWRFQPRGPLARSNLWRLCHRWFLELLLLAAVLPLLIELSSLWQPFALALLALGLLSEPASRWLAPRAQLYAVLLYWLSIACGLFQQQAMPTSGWQGWEGLLALQAVALQLLFALLAPRWLPATTLRGMAGLPLLGGVASALARHGQRWLWYPLFVAVAVQLARGFDHALLTLVWALEAFLIYGLSAVLRDRQFRLVALLALAACLLRLLVVDMAEADLGLRGLVFVGVGLLMLAMNALYKRFEDRFR